VADALLPSEPVVFPLCASPAYTLGQKEPVRNGSLTSKPKAKKQRFSPLPSLTNATSRIA